MTPEVFFQKYKDIAIKEMVRTGIPASITLAQAALESGWGESKLSKKANNFFGIKAHRKITGYEGAGFNIDTAEYTPAGEKYVESDAEFRAYDTPEGSFKDHSDFLRNNKRYDFIFDIDNEKDDYIGKWTTGLQKAGYATDPQYAGKLQKIISRYNLTQYDKKGIFKKKETTNESSYICPHCCNPIDINLDIQKADC